MTHAQAAHDGPPPLLAALGEADPGRADESGADEGEDGDGEEVGQDH